MINGKLKTWQVVRHLTRHPTHTAEAPEKADCYAARVRSERSALVFENRVGEWGIDNAPDLRSDWTIRSDRGRKVRFRKTPPKPATMTWPEALDYMWKHPGVVLVDDEGDYHRVVDERRAMYRPTGRREWRESSWCWTGNTFRVAEEAP